ncbi:MAG TPA: hypothetical protein PLD55_09660, partial [bacterium]|nr:hypothetical protein [bacterium]
MSKAAMMLQAVVNFLLSLECFTAEQIRRAEEALSDKPAPEKPLLLKQRDIAREVSVCRQTVQAWEKAGKIKPVLLPDGQK